MAKGASTEPTLGKLHNKLTLLFLKILQKYENDLKALSKADLGDELMDGLVADNVMPSPAMLSAIAKFLKDNEITMETETLDELSGMEQRLAAKRKARPALASVTNLPLINNG